MGIFADSADFLNAEIPKTNPIFSLERTSDFQHAQIVTRNTVATAILSGCNSGHWDDYYWSPKFKPDKIAAATVFVQQLYPAVTWDTGWLIWKSQVHSRIKLLSPVYQ